MQISKKLDFSALTGKKKNVGKRSFFALFPPSDPVETNRREANRSGWCAIRKKYRWHWVSFREIASRGTTLPTNRRKPLVLSFPCFSFVCAFRFFFFMVSPFFELDARTRSLVSIFASQCAAAATFSFFFFLKSIHGQLFVKHGRL